MAIKDPKQRRYHNPELRRGFGDRTLDATSVAAIGVPIAGTTTVNFILDTIQEQLEREQAITPTTYGRATRVDA